MCVCVPVFVSMRGMHCFPPSTPTHSHPPPAHGHTEVAYVQVTTTNEERGTVVMGTVAVLGFGAGAAVGGIAACETASSSSRTSVAFITTHYGTRAPLLRPSD